ncbi:hypothetical protein JYK02_01340 [Corallococcus macrosporus]|uniref:Uncharacterized protein n=1 Tax=Corallococcus macrosporus TaxID=35 RepID=A0ABS3D3D6_9BACT|nr:hypothetical protein [Corallococcus macrosporus]MBN8226147.1 hypothetical protein [Corallococcus macrosporus]
MSDAAYAQALGTQRRLSDLRQTAGRLQLGLDNRSIIQKGRDAFTGKAEATEAEIVRLKQNIAALENVERGQPQDAVERARFTVFNERMPKLELELGKSGAATIARQTYYNSVTWNVGRGSLPASEGKVLAAGLPHAPDYSGGQAVGGYGGRMRSPDGSEVDMGHVTAALDWQVNSARVPKSYLVPTVPPVAIPNPFTLDTVTLTGDVASAVRNTAKGNNAAHRADLAISREGNEDWYGDIDGLNLANRLRQKPALSITQALTDYYGTGQYQRRMDEFATHSRYIQRDAQGTPQRDAQGDYAVKRDLLARDAYAFSLVLDPHSINNPSKEVADAWVRWFKAQH